MRTVFVIGFALVTAPAIFAGQYTVSAWATGGYSVFDTNGVACSDTPGTVIAPSANASVACSGTTTDGAGPFKNSLFDFVGSATATASPAVLRAAAAASTSNAPFDFFHSAGNAEAEAMTANGYQVPGATGMALFHLDLTITGSSTSTGDAFGGANLTLTHDTFVDPHLLTGPGVIHTTPIPYDQSQFFAYNLDLFAGAILCASCTSATPAHQFTASASADFSHTVTITGITITDLAGNPITPTTFISSDGIDYAALVNGGVSAGAPEPGSWVLAMAGLAVMVRYSVRRR